MNAKELYLTIGQIDDDLILDACAKRGKQRKTVLRFGMIAAAACLCLTLFGGYLHFFGTVAVWNAGTTEYAAKFTIPEDSNVQSLSMEALTDYYHITLPDTLDDLSRISADTQIYTDAQGRVIYDRNVFRYESADGSRELNLTLLRASSAPENDEKKVSRIRGISVVLTENTSIPGHLLLSAQWKQNGTTLRLASEGLTQEELVSILKELTGTRRIAS